MDGHAQCVANLSRHKGFSPSSTGNGVRISEFAQDGLGAMGAFAELLRGPWSNDRVALVGEWSNDDDLPAVALDEAECGPATVWENIMASSGTGWGNVGWLARKVVPGKFEKMPQGWFRRYEYRPVLNVDTEPTVFINLDKKQVITPAGFGDDPRPGVYAVNGGGGGVLTALAVLLAVSNKGGPRGYGDLGSDHELIGSWGGDRITVLGADTVAALEDDSRFTVIDARVRQVLTDSYMGVYMISRDGVTRGDPGSPNAEAGGFIPMRPRVPVPPMPVSPA